MLIGRSNGIREHQLWPEFTTLAGTEDMPPSTQFHTCTLFCIARTPAPALIAERMRGLSSGRLVLLPWSTSMRLQAASKPTTSFTVRSAGKRRKGEGQDLYTKSERVESNWQNKYSAANHGWGDAYRTG